jgi:hypothetical protein
MVHSGRLHSLAVGSKYAQRQGARTLRAIAFTCVAALASALAPAGAPAESSPDEYEVKAAFLLNFARLVEWPKSAFADPRAPLAVGLLGLEASSAKLSNFLEGKPVGTHTVATREMSSAEESADFTQQGGAINFFTEDNKIRFEINPDATEAAGLRVSSRLMRVAKIVPGS